MSLNTGKIEIIISRTKKTETRKHMNFRTSGQKINIVKEAKYLGLVLDEHFTSKKHVETIKLKHNRANGFLAKIRYYADLKLLMTLYSAIF